jgi:hypothetical protein
MLIILLNYKCYTADFWIPDERQKLILYFHFEDASTLHVDYADCLYITKISMSISKNLTYSLRISKM